MKVSVENRNIWLRKVGSNPTPLPKRFVTLGQGLFILALWTFWAAQLFVVEAALRGVECSAASTHQISISRCTPVVTTKVASLDVVKNHPQVRTTVVGKFRD